MLPGFPPVWRVAGPVTRMRRLAGLLVALLLAPALVPPAASDASGDRTLRLAEFVFDPIVGVPELPPGWDRSSSVREDLHLIQFDGPVTDALLDRLRTSGLAPIQYVYPDTYLVWGHRAEREELDGRPQIRWTGDFAPAYRVLPQWRELEDDQVDLQVLLVREASDSALAAFAGLGAAPRGRRLVSERLEIAHVMLSGDRIPEAAHIEGVVTIQVSPPDWGPRGEATAQINAGNLDVGGLPVPGYDEWLSGLGLDGNGVTVGHVDEGIDTAHPDLASRIVPCSGATCSAVVSVHGTHTAGIIAGDATTGVIDSHGLLRGQGVAPGSSLVEQVYYPTLLEPAGMRELMRETRANGGTLSSNSWGRSNLQLGYDLNAMMVDAGVRDVDPEEYGDQPLIYVQAIANGSGGTSTLGVPDEAKNIISVGATIGIDGDGSLNADYDDLASVTAHGPALDGRTVPHLVAPGCYVDSTLPYGEGTDFGPRCGTSMAAPQVAGAVALFIQYYRGLSGTNGDPSPALVKSALLPVAHDLNGRADADGLAMGHRPDSRQGWGRLDISALLDPPPDSVLYFDQSEVFEFTGQQWERLVRPVDAAKPMRIMLAWTDAPGIGLGGSTPAWNNDLDLQVEVAGDTYLGNVFGADGLSATGGVADEKNNAEGVFLEGLASGSEVTLRVVAANINSDALPGTGDATDQDFALTCYNCELVSTFALTASPSVRDVCAPADATYRIEVEQLAGYIEPVTLSVTGVPAGGTSSFDVNPVAPGDSSTLTIGDTGSIATGDYTLEVTGESPDWIRSRQMQLRVRGGTPSPALLTAPLDGATDVDPLPLLTWDPVSWTDRYLVEIASDAGFGSIVYSAVSESASHTPRHPLRQSGTYFWRVRATNACGYGSFSSVSSFTTADLPDVLLVDDDGSQSTGTIRDVQTDYTTALDTIGVAYDVWDVWELEDGEEPDTTTFGRYEQIIWFTGEEEIYAGPASKTETALEGWLDRAGCLLITSADYLLNGDFDAFVQDRLGVASVDEDTGQDTVTGAGAVFTGLGPYTLRNANPDYSDTLNPDATAEVAFSGDLGPAAVDKDAGSYRTSFAGFGFERFTSASNGMLDSLSAFLDWCAGLPAIDGDSDGVTNADDCVAADPGVWSAPGEIDDLMIGSTGYSWTEPVSGSGAVYDVLRSPTPLDFYDATCVVTGRDTTSAPFVPELDPSPAPGDVVYYLARARNECGQSSLGQNVDGSRRYGNACE